MPRQLVRRDRQSFSCHLLNMGRTKYGDCVVVQCAGKTILIDGGHPGDDKDRDDRPSIPVQLGSILGGDPPYHFDLLIVTHCHQDHIGCLPKLVARHLVTCDRALVADEKLGFGLDANGLGDARVAGADFKIRGLVDAITEEDHSNLQGADLDQFLADAATLQDNYNDMLRTLARNANVVRYRQGTPAEQQSVSDLVAEMSATGLKIFGPTADQLVHCAETIQRISGDAADLMDAMADAAEPSAEIYKRFMASTADAADAIQHAAGWAKNCQSIVLAFGDAGERVLLPGDMQFAEPGIPEIEASVQQLRRDVAREAPYVFVKLPHHTSHNGIDEHILEEWGWPPLLGHSGGYNDPTHPYPETLEMLKRLKRQHPFSYARTDRNGLIIVDPRGEAIDGESGRLNDFTPNGADDEGELVAEPLQPKETVKLQRPANPRSSEHFVEITFVRIPYLDGEVSVDGRPIKITRPKGISDYRQRSRPPEPTDQDRERPPPTRVPPRAVGPNLLAAGRELPPLLFVTDPARLKANVGEDADRALSVVRSSGHRLVTGAASALMEATRLAILESQPKGVVLLGGYDVVFSQRVDVLGPDLRGRIPSNLVGQDRDGFVVWSDDVYGDKEPDGVPEVPVSRVPDARMGSFLLSMLTSAGMGQAGKFGLRNSERPFAEAVYAAMPGSEPIQVSAPSGVSPLQRQLGARENVYFMLHGDYRNSLTFWGEDNGGNTPAIDVSSLPTSGVGIAFAGCCWGALTVSEPAFLSGDIPTPRMVERSIALSLLKAGARAFVGATGVHYSPDAGGEFFGGPLHKAFWREVQGGSPPALALFNARQAYLLEIPHGRPALWNQAVERKLYKQFTCLGLGW